MSLSKSTFVNYVPKYYLLRWQRFCDKFKNTNQINDYDNLLHKARSNANRWVRMDAGRYRNDIEDDRDKYQLTCLPRNYKMQGIGESTCVFSSLISALHYIHDYHGRDLLVDKLHKSVDYSQLSIECTMNRENYAAKLLNEKGNYKVNTLKSYDVLHNQSMWPTLCILKGSDDGIKALMHVHRLLSKVYCILCSTSTTQMPFPSTCHAPSRSYVGAPSAISWLPSEQMRQKKKKGDRELFWALSVLRAQYPTSLSVLCPGEMCNNKAYSSNTYNLVEQLPEEFYITAENAYCFSFTLFIPFSGRGKQDISKDAFIFFLSQLRIQIEQVFGLLVTKWQVFKKPVEFALC